MADTTSIPAGTKEAPKSFARRDQLRQIEKTIQARWDSNKEFEGNAPTGGASNKEVPKYMVTFPYPYMNGRLHLGHAFTVSKAEFAAGFQRLLGKQVLFPFAFHCTGMPIQAAANRLKREYEDGIPEQVLARLASEAEAGPDAVEEEIEAESAAPEPEVAEAKPDEPKAQKELGKYSGKKSKAIAKGTAGAKMSQFEILVKSGLAPADIPAFRDPKHWLRFFPPLGEADLRAFGLHTDWRRSFITTDANPYYDSFIRWQFNTLKSRGKIGFGKRPTVFSPMDGQACADHDRASGEGVGPQEYTLIKIRMQSVPAGHRAGDAGKLDGLKALIAEGRPVYLVAATLRPETMYGQTNCFLLPEGEYGAYAMTGPAAGEGGRAVYICAERSARNMSYQSLFSAWGVVEPALEAPLLGEDLLGLPCTAPYAVYPTVYTLPLLTISMKKGTGVVTSVPSDAPDDWAALRDLKEKPKLREKFGLTDEMVNPFDAIPIIDIPGYGNLAALAVCDTLKIKSQNDKDKLATAKEMVYMAGFYQGTLLVGKYAGKKVADAKPLVKADMMAEGHAAVYYEPESSVMSRSGDECVVANIDQWFLRYGAPEWRAVVEAWAKSGKFATFNLATAAAFDHVLAWLQEWACSRSFGLGTQLPWDPQFVIESLSDSTIYMAYYTIAHMLHGGSMDGSTTGSVGVLPSALNDACWDYIFLEGPYPEGCAVPQPAMEAMRAEFMYWYPLDLRVSGKDLINNHLTMSLYNHAAIWMDHAAPAIIAATGAPSAASTATSILGENGALPGVAAAGGEPAPPVKVLPAALAEELATRMPAGFFCNGHVLVDGKKMSKSIGNFILLHEAIDRWSADGARFALADAGDTLDDANYDRDNADNAILRLTTEAEYAKHAMEELAAGALRTGDLNFGDRVFNSRMSVLVLETRANYEGMKFREALKTGFYDLQLARDSYRDACEKLAIPAHADVVRTFLDLQTVMMAPICPHWAEWVWGSVLGHWNDAPGLDGKVPSVTRTAWPTLPAADTGLLELDRYLQAKLHEFRLAILKAAGVKASKVAKGAPVPPKPTDVNIFVAAGWPVWQLKPLELLASLWDPAVHGTANYGFTEDALKRVQDLAGKDAELKPFLKKIMPLAALTIQSMKGRTEPTPTLARALPFDEYTVWMDNLDYVKKALEVPGSVSVYRIDDPTLAPGSDSAKVLDPTNRAKEVTPMEPEVAPYVKA